MKRGTKAIIAVFLIMQLVLSLGAGVVFAQSNSDIKGHWAEDKITQWLDKGLVNGYPDGSFKPNKTVTRAEFVKTVNQVFRVSMNTDVNLSFADLPEKHWAYEEVKAAVGQGYVNGVTATTFAPNQAVTRQEAAVMLTSLLKLTGEEANVTFKDASQVASWAKDAVDALVNKGILNGDNNGNVNPRQPLTRAEAVILLSNASDNTETVLSAAGTYGSDDKQTIIEGNVRITSTGVKLLNTKITGNLVIDKAVGEGDVYLNKVEVQGDTLVQGGGENSIHVEDSIIVRIIADKVTGKVRIVAIGSTSVYEVIVQSSIKLEELKTTGSGFNKVELSKNLAANSEVSLIGGFTSINLLATQIKVNITSGSVDQFSVGEGATGNEVALSKEAKIINLLLDIVAQFTGDGTIEKAVIGKNASGSTFKNEPKEKQEDKSGEVTLPPVTSPPNTGGAPVGGDNGSPTPTPSPSPTSDPTDASLHSITFSGEVDIVLKKAFVQDGSSVNLNGFDSGHFEYISFIENNGGKYNVKIQFTTEEKSVVFADIRNIYEERFLAKDVDGGYTIELDSSIINTISFIVISEDDKNSEWYIFKIHPSTIDVNKAFMLNKSGYFSTNSLLVGDVVRVTVPAEDSSTGSAYEIELIGSSYGNYLEGSADYLSGGLNKNIDEYFNPAELTGELEMQILRDGVVIGSGQYHYDFSSVTLEQIDSSIFSLELLSTEELIQRDLSLGSAKTIFAYLYNADVDRFKEVNGEFAYYSAVSHTGDYYLNNTTKEHTKRNWIYGVASESNFATEFAPEQISGHIYFPNYDGEINTIDYNKVIFQINLYDSNMKFIKALYTEVTLTEDYIGPNVVISTPK